MSQNKLYFTIFYIIHIKNSQKYVIISYLEIRKQMNCKNFWGLNRNYRHDFWKNRDEKKSNSNEKIIFEGRKKLSGAVAINSLFT